MHGPDGEHGEAVRALLLDALGTLVALDPPAPALRDELVRRFGTTVALTDAERAMAAEIAYYRAHFDEGRDLAAVAALRRRCAAVVGDMLGLVLDDDRDLDALTAALLASLRFRAFAEVADVLAAARARGIRLVVVSNWDASLHEVLARLGLAALLDGVVISAEVGARKPAPEIFARALDVAGVEAREALHVGDSVAEDVAGARAAGIRAVLIARDGPAGGAGHPPDVPVIRSLADVELGAPSVCG